MIIFLSICVVQRSMRPPAAVKLGVDENILKKGFTIG
tara:strand:+ start:391 stop:501 length:111 start_codon:yes stop_codon:yes gene_type:complete